jgi:predicted nuclease of restriction endonuclease-like RecB superfamily
LLPASLLLCSLRGDEVVPRFLGENDHPWLRLLLEEYDRYVGRPQRELQERLGDPLGGGAFSDKQRLAVQVLRRLCGTQLRSEVLPKRARAVVFGKAAQNAENRDTILSSAAEVLDVSPIALEKALFADLPGERVVTPLEHPLSPLELALRANLALAQGFVFRAAGVKIEVEGNARAVVRYAKLRGLICRVARSREAADAVMEISGPFALFRHTLVYGRALGDTIPLLSWCRRFRLRADCMLRGRRRTLRLASGDPIFPSSEPRRYDSLIEERFARDFMRLAPDWDVVREPEPVESDGSLIFPDFAIQHRTDASRRWLLEIVGFWTPDYVTRKLAQYRAASISNLILCIDADRCCQDGDLPQHALVIRYRRRVDAAEVYRRIETVL